MLLRTVCENDHIAQPNLERSSVQAMTEWNVDVLPATSYLTAPQAGPLCGLMFKSSARTPSILAGAVGALRTTDKAAMVGKCCIVFGAISIVAPEQRVELKKQGCRRIAQQKHGQQLSIVACCECR